MIAYRKPHRVKKRKPLLKNKAFWATLFLFFFLLSLIYFILFSETFQLKEIRIEREETVLVPGQKNVSEETLKEIKSLVEKEARKKVFFQETKSIFLLDLQKIKETVLERFIQLAFLRPEKKWPSSVLISVGRRKGVAVFCKQDDCWLVDEQGIAFEKAQQEELYIFPLIKNPSILEGSLLGSRVLEPELLSKLRAISSYLEEFPFSCQELVVVSEEKIDVVTEEGWLIYFHAKKDLEWQVTKLKAVLDNYIPAKNRQDLEYIELRFGNLAPFKYQEE